MRGELSIVTPPREEIKDPSGTYNTSTNIKRSKKEVENYVETLFLLRRLERLRNPRVLGLGQGGGYRADT